MLFELRNSTSQCDLRYGMSMVGGLTSTLGRRLATRPNTDLPEPLIPISSRSKTLLFWRPSNDGVRAGEDPRERQGLTHPWSGPRDGPRTHRASPISRPGGGNFTLAAPVARPKKSARFAGRSDGRCSVRSRKMCCATNSSEIAPLPLAMRRERTCYRSQLGRILAWSATF